MAKYIYIFLFRWQRRAPFMKINLGCAFYGSLHFTPATTNNVEFFFRFLSFLSYLMKVGGNLSGFLAGNQAMDDGDDDDDDEEENERKMKREKKKWINRDEVLVKAFKLFTFWIQSIFNK